MMKIAAKDVFEKIHDFTRDEAFSIKFKKVNGEIREYASCRMHVVPEAATGTGVSPRTAHETHDALKFFADDVNGYRTAKIANIVEFEKLDTHEKYIVEC